MDAACRNCATPLAGRWCHACGQDSRDPLRAVAVLVEEFLESALSWDSRLMRTLKLMVTQPGALPDAFVAGRRASYLGPVRLYVLMSVLYVLTTAAVGSEGSLEFLVGGGDLIAGQSDVARASRWLSLLLLLMMPFAALLMALAFHRRGIGFVQHLAFTLYLNSVTLLAWSVAAPLAALAHPFGGGGAELSIAVAFNFVVIYYAFLAARRHYRRGDIDSFLRIGLYGLLSAGMLRGFALLAARIAGG